jgi:hypothetical protein
MVNFTFMYMVYAICKYACMHMRTVHTIYTQPHMCTDTDTHTHIHTILLAVIIHIEKNIHHATCVNLNKNGK